VLRLVIDCNVLVAATRGSDTCCIVLVRAIAAHEPVVSAPILAEYREVGTRPKHLAYRAAFDVMIGRWKGS
jgi:predicted nucleic acid-binding protein